MPRSLVHLFKKARRYPNWNSKGTPKLDKPARTKEDQLGEEKTGSGRSGQAGCLWICRSVIVNNVDAYDDVKVEDSCSEKSNQLGRKQLGNKLRAQRRTRSEEKKRALTSSVKQAA
ncbi:hypothetical protein F511_25708 [Dorcoceras hygrometricum]|uniref:Uncharacterized protein n=1 Tax=Dorcoceras hygrometricum TaxID=472368 RepID=A0A2Z7AAP3_9LAMI|nr:hypothetical protein F511_25708 [Dorcoceras hygrometricum]